MKKQINTDTRFTLQQFYHPYDEKKEELDLDNPVYLEPIIYFNDLTAYHDIVKKHFSKSKHYLQLIEWYHNAELIHEIEHYNDIYNCVLDSRGCLENVDLEKLNNTLDSIN